MVTRGRRKLVRKTRGLGSQLATKRDVQKSQEELAGMFARSFKLLATKVDIKSLEQRIGGLEQSFGGLERRIGGIDQRLGDIEKRFGGQLEDLDKRVSSIEERMATRDQLERLLVIVESIEKQLKEYRSLPDRVTRLEQFVFQGSKA